ncbi:MAG: aminopeptidase P family protein [Gemmatimonadota bacterium]
MSYRTLNRVSTLGFVVALFMLRPLGASAQVGSPAGAVPVDRLQARRAALMARMGSGVAVIRSMEERSDDPPDSEHPQDSDYREDSDFFYLTGLEAPGSWLILVAKERGAGEVYLYLPARNPVQERWTGPQLGPGAEAARLTGIPEANIRPAKDAEQALQTMVTDGGSPAMDGGLFFKEDARHGQLEVLHRILSLKTVKAKDLLPHLAALRQVKDQDEIARIRKAAQISAEGHVAAMKTAKPGIYEYEIEAVAEMTFRRLGAERLAYPSIVGAGINGTTLHYDKNRARTAAGDLIVMDMAAEYGYYAADVTRTIPASGMFTDRQKAIYNLVLGAQQAVMDSIRPGMTLLRLHQISVAYIQSHSNGLCGSQSCEKFYIHGCCHHIGMEVHDVNTNGPLVAGMTFTVEPGIYLPEEKLGVRIEDDVLVTPNGYELLSGAAPRTVEEVERVMRG